jgi:hypothetical protein
VSDFFLVVILLAFFALAIGLVQVLSRMIDPGTHTGPGTPGGGR